MADDFKFELEETDLPDVDTARDYLSYEKEYTPEEAAPPKTWDANYLPSNIGPIRDMMTIVRGDAVDDWDDDELQEKYLETMRGFEVGNVLTTTRFFQGMIGSDKDKLQKIGRGIQVYDNMGSAFGEGATGSDKLQAVGDFAQGLILDPANLLGLGLGKLFTGAGAKVAATGARIAAVKALKEGGEQAGKDVFQAALKEAGEKTVAGITQRAAATEATKGIRRLGTKTALKDAGITIAADTAVAVGTELVYQDVRTTTGVQDEMNYSHVALAALGTMALGGVAYSSNLFKGSSGWNPAVRNLNEEADTGAVLRAIIDVAETDSWKSKVARGTQLKDMDAEYWIDLMDNMLPAMEREGYVWVRRSDDDKVSNWLADVMKSAEPEDARIFAKEWSEATGIELPSLDEKGLDFFADSFANKMNESARTMSKASEVARRLGKDNATVGDMLEDAVNGGTDAVGAVPFTRFSPENMWAVSSTKVSKAQNNIIRLIVSNLSTTRLNLVGYGASAGMNVVSDISQAILYHGPQAALYRTLGKTADADEAWKIAKAHVSSQVQRAKNMVDPNTTYDQFLAYQQMRPQQLRELTSVLQGGIEDPSQIAKYYGLKPTDTVAGAKMDKVVDMIQQVNFVQAQDVYTKSQEFLAQLDKKVRIAFDRPLQEVLADPNLRTLMSSKQWAKAEAEAVWETQRAIYSASYKRMGGEFGRGAAFIEDFRNIPYIGLTIPFGRFFNNVVATTMDASGLSLAGKLAGYYPNRSFQDLATRATVTWTAVSMLADKENEYIDRGLGVFESENSKGEVVDNRYTYPLSLYKGLSRLVAYHRKGEEPPANVLEEMKQDLAVWKTMSEVFTGEGEVPPNVAKQFRQYSIGQLTRDLAEANEDIIRLFDEILGSSPDDKVGTDLLSLFASPIVSAISGGTRFLEPLSMIKKAADGMDMKQLDPKDGNKLFNDAFRYLDAFGISTSNVEKIDTVSGARVPQLDKYFGDRSSKLTNIERVLNLVGIDQWSMDERKENIAANNIFAKYHNSFLDQKASELMALDKFRNGDLEMKTQLWSDVKTVAREHTKAFMALKGGDTAIYQKTIDIWKGHSADAIARAMQDVAPDKEMSDLSMNELEILDSYLKSRADFLRLQ